MGTFVACDPRPIYLSQLPFLSPFFPITPLSSLQCTIAVMLLGCGKALVKV